MPDPLTLQEIQRVLMTPQADLDPVIGRLDELWEAGQTVMARFSSLEQMALIALMIGAYEQKPPRTIDWNELADRSLQMLACALKKGEPS